MEGISRIIIRQFVSHQLKGKLDILFIHKCVLLLLKYALLYAAATEATECYLMVITSGYNNE